MNPRQQIERASHTFVESADLADYVRTAMSRDSSRVDRDVARVRLREYLVAVFERELYRNV